MADTKYSNKLFIFTSNNIKQYFNFNVFTEIIQK